MFLPQKQNKTNKQKIKHRVGGNIWNNGYVCLDIDYHDGFIGVCWLPNP